MLKEKDYKYSTFFIKIIIFDIGTEINQTKIKWKKKNNYDVDVNNGNVLIIKVPKWMSILHVKQWKQWLNLLTQEEHLYYMAKNWVNFNKVMTNTWPRGWHHNVISFNEWNGRKTQRHVCQSSKRTQLGNCSKSIKWNSN